MATPEFDDMVKMLTDILNEREFSGPPEWKATWDTLVAEVAEMPEGAVVDIPNEIPLVEPPEGGWTPREPVAPAAPEGNADTPVAAANLRGGNFSYQLPSNPAGPVHMIQWGTPEGSWVSRAKTFDRNSDAVIVSLEPTPLEKSALAVGDGAAADGLHVTLCKLGTVEGLGDEGRRLIGSVCALLGAEYRPIEASIGGIGWFGAADASTVALVNGAELPALRHAVCSALAEAGFPAVDDLGFMPHVTLADGPVDAASVVGQSLTFNELRVRWGNEVLAFDLIGIAKPPVAPEPILEIAPEAPLTSAERLEAALEVFGGPGSGPHKHDDSGGESPKQGTLPGTEQKPSIGDRLRGLVGKDPKGALPDGPAPGYGTVTPMKWTENTQGPETGHDPKYDGPSYTGVGSVTNATGAEQETRNVISSNAEQTEFTYDVSIHIADDPGGVREIPAGTDTGTAPSLDEAKAAGDALIEAAAADHVAAVDQAVAEAAPSGRPATPDPGNWYFTGERWAFTAEEVPSEVPPVDITSIPDDALAIELGRRAAVQAVEALEADGGEVSASAKAMIEENALDAVDSALSAAIQGLASTEVATDEIPVDVADAAEATDPVERDAVTAAAIRARLRARRAAREEAFNGGDSPVVVIEVEVEGREDDDEGDDDDGMEMCDECGAVMEPMDGHCSECGAMIVPPMGEMMASTPDRPYEWEGVLTVEGVPSGDNRMISEGSLTWRELPVPLMLQTVNAPGHEGAVICGSIVEVERDGKSIVGRGYFSANDAGGAARQLLDEKSMRGISVDIDSVQMVFADPAGVELSRDQAMEAHAFGDGEVLELIVSGRVMGACYDEETEILSENHGWLPFADLPVGERVATMNPKNGAFEWQEPVHYTNDPWSGPMVRFTSGGDSAKSHRMLDLLVTPNHRMLVESIKTGERLFMRADELAMKSNRSYRIPLTSEWDAPDVESIYVDGTLWGTDAEWTMDGDSFAALLGAYLSEGCLYRGDHGRVKGVFIAQQPGSKGREMFSLLAERIGMSSSDRGFTFSDSRFGRWAAQFGTATEKFVPDEVKSMSARQIGLFLDYFIAGDGDAEGRRIYTSSKRLADDIQELAQKAGMWAVVSERPYRESEIDGRPVKPTGPSYVVALRNRPGSRPAVACWDWKAEHVDHHEGMVRCVTVPNESLYVRRNGTPCWCGNTLTPFPAFQEAHVYLLGPTENAPEALVASASGPIYRSTRPADVVLAGDDMLGALVASAGGAAAAPPAAWFQLQPMDVPVPFTVSADGRCYGLLAQFGTCHIGNSGVCVEVPQSNDFRSFYTGKTVLTAEGTSLSVGPIIMDTVHPNLRMQASDAQAFYAHTGCAVADVRLYTNDHGIVAAGCVRPEVDELTVRRFRASDISPDWRPIGGQRRLVSLLAVNTSGFLVEGIAASAGRFQPWGLVDLATGELGALVAAGAIHNPDRRTVGDELAEMQARLAQQDSMISVLMAPHVAADRRARTAVAMSALGLDCGCGCGGASGASCSTERDARLAAALGLLDGPRRGAAVPVG